MDWLAGQPLARNWRARSDSISGSVRRLPLELRFRDESGGEIRLGELFGQAAGHSGAGLLRCPLLCDQVLTGLARSLKPLSLVPGKDFEIVAFSITRRNARARRSEEGRLHRAVRPAGHRARLAFPDGRRGVDRGTLYGDRFSIHA